PFSFFHKIRDTSHLNALAQYLRPTAGAGRPTEDDALNVLRTLNVERGVPASGYTCLEITNGTPAPTEIVGWEHTLRAQVIGNAQKYGLLLVVQAVFCLVVMNLYYRGLVYIVCGPRKKPDLAQT
ncbi:MAG: hypothetical protein ACRD26_04380, partial [Vicinamibacterales bacterium]